MTARGTLFLDSDGVSRAASGDLEVRAHLQVALRRRARVVASASTLTETLRGTARDALVRRVLTSVTVLVRALTSDSSYVAVERV